MNTTENEITGPPPSKAALLGGFAIVIAIAFWYAVVHHARPMVQKATAPVVMGTTCRLIGVGPEDKVDEALRAALAELQAVDAAMSTYRSDSELSRLNAAPAGVDTPLSKPTLSVLHAAQEMGGLTGGAFDITIRPLSKLWAAAAENDAIPTEEEIQAVRQHVGFAKIEVGRGAARKTVDGLEISLDAIAKGYAIDRALEAMKNRGVAAGLVDVGGDIRCFGVPLDAPAWRCAVQNPWSDDSLSIFLTPVSEKKGLAVCTSGDYRRFVTIGGKRYSHILDPRTGRPTEAATSVTVISPDAMTADAWATALSVLGPDEGLPLVEEEPDVEALLITGDSAAPKLHRSSGFDQTIPEETK